MLQVFEVSATQLTEMTGIAKSTLLVYLQGWRFAHIRKTEKRKKLLYKKTGKHRTMSYYTVTNKDIQALRAFKQHRLRQSGIIKDF